jgi:NAD(P)-dependent dehydrogenase (short-subunit alcohol dehydrogenase family)
MSTIPKPQSDINLLGRKILITGGARGLGEAFARACLQAGAKVVITDVMHQLGETLAQDLNQQYPDRIRYFPMDVSQRKSIDAAMLSASNWLGGLDGLVNNAAVTNSGGKNMDEITEQTWDHVMQVNVKGVWLTSLAAVAHLAKSDAGRIVNLASDTALWGAPRLMAYVASKGAVMSMTKSMARELAAQGITVNAIAPGLTLVEATQYVPQARHDFYANGRAITRAQLPDDVTAAVLFLLAPSSGFITGQILPVNGGFYMQ